jgi:hypothetical protein
MLGAGLPSGSAVQLGGSLCLRVTGAERVDAEAAARRAPRLDGRRLSGSRDRMCQKLPAA